MPEGKSLSNKTPIDGAARREEFISYLNAIYVFTSSYLFAEMDSCIFFSLKADYYSKPVEKSFSCLHEMNKVSGEVKWKRIIVTAVWC